MKKKSILSILLAVIMVLSLTSPAFAATKTSTKTITFKSCVDDYRPSFLFETTEFNSPDVTIKATNVTSVKTKDFSVKLSDDDGNKVTFEGKKSKVVYCKADTTITLKPNGGEDNACYYGLWIYYDAKKVKSTDAKITYQYYDASEELDFSKKLTKAPEYYVFADGTSIKIKKPGTYVLYVDAVGDTPIDDLNPVFIVVQK